MKDWAKTERRTWRIFHWSSDTARKHLNILTVKGAMLFEDTDSSSEKDISFWYLSKLFEERYELLQVNYDVVLNLPVIFDKNNKSVEHVWSVSRNHPKKLRGIFAFWWPWLFIRERNLVLKHEWTVLGEIWAFADEIQCCEDL